MAGFLIDPSKGETPASVAKKRAILQSMLMPYGKADNIGEGFAQLLNGVASGMQNRKLNKIEQSGQESGNATRQSVLSMLAGSMSPSAQSAPVQQNAAPDAMPPVSTAPVGKVDRSPIAAKIAETANALGLSPVDLGTAISYETAGTFDPQKKGPTTQWGQHKGLIQFGEPQAKKFGVDWNNPVDSQLGPDGAVANYLRSTGVKPGMGLMDIYSAINAGGVGRNNRSDANNGGAPGTVADKVNKQMSGHRRNAERLLAAFQGQQTQVASLDPSAGLASMIPQPSPRPMNGGLEAIAASMGQPSPQSIAPPPQAAPAPVQMAQAAPQEAPPQAPAVPPMPTGPTSFERVLGLPTQGNAQPSQGMNMQMLMEAANNPWLDDNTRQMVNSLIEREMQKQDPSYQQKQQMQGIEMQKAQLELQQMQNPAPAAPKFENVGGRLVQIMPDGTVSEAYAPPPEPMKPPALPAGIQEYEYAKGQGFPGTFQDWEASKKGGMSLQVDPTTGQVTFQQGGNIKPMTEAQSKDTVYATRAEGALPLLDEFADDMTGVIGNTVGQLPLVGNALKPERFQKGEQAGNEFLQAILRKDTGAAITEGEQVLYGNTYIPRMGDGDGVKAQKKAARFRALQAMKAGMPAQAILAQEQALQKSGNSPMPPLSAPPGEKKRLKFNPATGELE